MSGRRAGLALGLAALSGCAAKDGDDAVQQSVFDALSDDALRPLVVAMGADRSPVVDETNRWSGVAAAIPLGEALFFDRRLSGSGGVSCGDCHRVDLHFTDGQALPTADGAPAGPRHTPSVLNAGLQRWQFWDGRCDSLWCQATGPIENPLEMNLGRADLGRVLLDAPDLGDPYRALAGLPDELAAIAEPGEDALPAALRDPDRFPPGARPRPDAPEAPEAQAWAAMAPEDQAAATRLLVDVAKLIAAYEGQLTSGPAPIDAYAAALAEDDPVAAADALSPAAARGLLRFVTDGQCVLCHTGPLFTNLEFEAIGLPAAPGADPDDTGRYDGARALQATPFNAAGPWSDAPEGAAAARLGALRADSATLAHFKVPSLRDVAATAPYMHTGQLADLSAVVDHYSAMDAEQPLGDRSPLLAPLGWSAEDRADMVHFLESLSGDSAAAPAWRSPAPSRSAPAAGSADADHRP
jgi:cytochrome c peroxidase